MSRRPLRNALIALVAVLAAGTLGYHLLEGWTWLDSVWMVVITLTTIGFGEAHPLDVPGRLFTIGLIVAGVTIGTWTMSAIGQAVVDGELARWVRRNRRRRQMEKLSGHCIVAGYGRLGRTIVTELLAAHTPVAVIERDAELVREVEAAGIPVVPGDAADDAVLRAAGVERARSLAVAVSGHAEAVYATLSARQLNPGLNIVTRVMDPSHAQKAFRAGATSVVNPHTMGGWRMAQGLLRPHASSFLDVATLADVQSIQLEEVAVTRSAGKPLGSLALGREQGVLVAAIRRANGAMVPVPLDDELLGEGDVLIVLGRPDAVRALLARSQS